MTSKIKEEVCVCVCVCVCVRVRAVLEEVLGWVGSGRPVTVE